MRELRDELVTALAGRYEIERELGHGGMAVVYLAHDARNGRKVALKVMRPQLTESLGAERFLQEVAIAAPLVHPNILPIFDSGAAAGFLYYTMPFVEGRTLRERLDREVQLPIEDALSIARQIASALDYAHARGAVHRDIKPDNILLQDDHVFVADFGLARAITRSASTPLTTQGIVLGTAPYMSPEQCTPGGKANPPSDIYSLGCVVFEMIAGMPPFRGATADVVMSHHQMSAPPSLSAERKSCPSGLDAAVRRALAKVPADRFRTAGDFVRALESSVISDAPPGRVEERSVPIGEIGRQIMSGRRVLVLGGIAALILVLTAAIYAGRGIQRERALDRADTTKVVVFPVVGDSGLPLAEVHELFSDAARRWRGVTFVDASGPDGPAARKGLSIPIEGARWAVDHEAGRFIVPRLSRVGDDFRLHATLYDVRGPRRLSEMTVRLPVGLAGSEAVLVRLTDSLLLRDAFVGGVGSHMLPAIQMYAAGRRAVTGWNLPLADSLLDLSLKSDPGFGQAALWLAQVQSWRHSDYRWMNFASRAAASGQLSPIESRLANALLLIGRGQFAAACAEYDAVTRENDREFAAWYGLGECRRQDGLVVRDPRSPSGWTFRSSYHRAMLAYTKALELWPALHRGFQPDAFQRLRSLLYIDRGLIREGFGIESDSLRFQAYPTWQGDSLAFVPYPTAGMSTVTVPMDPTAIARALRHQREVFRRIAHSWSAGLPNSPGPKEAVALSLEMVGDSSAVDTLRLARRLSTNPLQTLWLAVEEVLMQLEFARSPAQVDRVRALSDSLLAANANATGDAGRIVAPLAALRGKCKAAGQLTREGATASKDLPRHLIGEFEALTVSAALGCREPDFLATADRLAQDVMVARPDLSPSSHHDLEVAQLSRASALIFPVDSVRLRRMADASNDYLWQAQKAALIGDSALVRSILLRIGKSRGPGRGSPDALYPETVLWLAIGDSIAARRWLDGVLLSPGWLTKLIDDPVGVASFMRCFALRAQIATPSESESRLRWARIVATLWAGGDPGPSFIAESATRLVRREN